MKVFVIALAIANLVLAVFVYLRESAPNPDRQIMRQQLNADQIRIIPPPAPRALTPAKVSAVAATCLEWSGFGPANLPGAEAALEGLALGEKLRKVDVTVQTTYWVYVPPQRSKADLDRKLKELKDLGISDLAPVIEGVRWRYAISLGLFRNEEGAKKFLATVREKGVPAQLGPREQRVNQIAFLVREPSETQSSQISTLKNDYPGSEMRSIPCPAS
ncbi:MAG: SPOR domain-containing protein [Betaproteobacteria bacterium]